MKSINSVFILGYLGADPQVTTTSNGKEVANFSVALDESYVSKEGEKVERTEWVNCTVFGPLAEIVKKYLHKGDRVHVTGKLRTDKVEKDGEKKYYTKVKVENIVMLSGRKNEPHHPIVNGAPASGSGPGAVITAGSTDEDLPF